VKQLLHEATSEFQDVLARSCATPPRAQLHGKTRAERTACCCADPPLACPQVFESETYGRVLVLDGCIQLTERDEFSYQARRGAAHASRRLA
jgi:hypothetical protein